MPHAKPVRTTRTNAPKSMMRRTRSRRRRRSETPRAHPLLHLQQTLGNRAVGRILQAKLTVSRSRNPFEREADRVADQVVQMPDSVPSPATPLAVARHAPTVQRMPETEDDLRVLQGPHEAFEGPLEEDEPVIRRMSQHEGEEEPDLQMMPMAEAEDETLQMMPVAGEDEDEVVPRLQPKPNAPATPAVSPTVASHINHMRGAGRPLAPSVRAYFEPRLGADLSEVRVHTDTRAAGTAKALQARAFTVGREVTFGAGEYAPSTMSGRKLLAHELTHVMQQKGDTVQRQEIPPELQTSVHHQHLPSPQLQQRYDLIASTLSQFNQSTPETARLEQEIRAIAAELLRRETSRTSSLAAGRTFSPAAIDRLRDFFVQNARAANPLNCIDTMNSGLRRLLADSSQRVGSAVHQTMARLASAGRAGAGRVVEFNDARGRMTRGVQRPHTLRQSVWDVVIGMAGGDVGWSVFGLSLMDGYHSVTLTLDNNDPGVPIVYWSDQWSSRGGWQRFDRDGLDREITRWTQTWWDAAPANRKPRTRTTLWRLRQ